MATASWKGSIRFGPLVRFGVKAVAVDREAKFPFNKHHAADGGRLRLGESICETCGEAVASDQMVRGYKGVPGVDEAYLESLAVERTAVMELDGLVPAADIEPRMYNRSYDVIAEKGDERTYVLFMRLLEESGRVAVGKITDRGQERLVAVRPRNGILEMELLWWPEELKADTEAKAAIEGVDLSEKELALGRQLVSIMARDYDPSAYRNEYAAAVGEYLDAFIAGKEPVKLAPKAQEAAAPAMSLEDALAASLTAMAETPTKPKKAVRKSAA